ncbi:restriction endonuclease subunit S [Flavobacteriaceae bacterium]|nr:restriction endonuclease subunit S [Flavobacteriaceae bacterium]
MKSWKNAKIGDLCKVKGGKRLPSGHSFSDIQTDYIYIRARDIKSGKINFQSPVYIDIETREKIIRYTVDEGDIVLTIAGTIGETAIIDSNLHGASLTENAVKLNAFSGVEPSFLMYFLLCPSTKDYFDLIASGSAQPKLGIYKINNTIINYPSLAIQKKIASILSAYDDLIENNLKRIKLLEEKAQLTYEEWFVRMKYPGHENDVVDSETGLPEGWYMKKLEDLIHLNYGKALKADSRINGNIKVYGSSGIVGTHNTALVKGPGIIVGRKGNVGSVFLEEGDFFPIDTVYYVDSIYDLSYLYYLLRSLQFVNNDAAVPGLNRNMAYRKDVVIPKESLLKKFSFTTPCNSLINEVISAPFTD